jgi:hypothetical protein
MWTADTAAAIRSNKLQQHADRLTTELMDVSFIHQLLAAAAGLHNAPACAHALLTITCGASIWACILYIRAAFIAAASGQREGSALNVTAMTRVPALSPLQVVNKVRGQLSSLQRKILSALIVIDVHARDVAAELASKGVSSETDFDFVSQLR